jgi:hypothetical protein
VGLRFWIEVKMKLASVSGGGVASKWKRDPKEEGIFQFKMKKRHFSIATLWY